MVPLRVLADELRSRGHRVVIAARDITRAYGVFQDTAWEPPYNFAQLLYNSGFDDCVRLTALVRAWIRLFELLRPDLVVLDHSPTALLALRAWKAKRILFGVGFSIPVCETPLRSIRQFPPPDIDRMFQDEQRVLRTINEVLSCLQCAPIASVAQLFAEVEDRFLTTYRELGAAKRDRSIIDRSPQER